jgi:putative ABC transport system permease protein
MTDATDPGRASASIARAVFSFRVALDGVAHNTLRAALTSVGILFGTASVIAMLAIGRGAQQEILEQMRLLGTNNIIVTPLAEQSEGAVEPKPADEDAKAEPKRFTPGLTDADAREIGALIPAVDATTGELVLNTTISREGHRRTGKLVGADSTYFRLLNLPLESGAIFTHEQVDNGASVAIIGHSVKTRFFTTQDPLGQRLKVGDAWLTVVGVLEDRRIAPTLAQKLGVRDANMDVYIPLSTALLRYRNRALVTKRDVELGARQQQGNNYVIDDGTQSAVVDEAKKERRNYHQLDRIVVRVADATKISPVAEIVRRMLERRHNDVVDFEVTVPELLLQQERRTRTIFNIVLGAIASISLIVGGIGIMNIMLASVLERIREIGVRRAMGATQRDILWQFLQEAMMISLAGGIAGVLAGAGLSAGIEHFAHIQTLVSPLSVLTAFGVSLTVGVVFGIVPAWRAARQDPVVCLHAD